MNSIIHIAPMYRDSEGNEYGLAVFKRTSSKEWAAVIYRRPGWSEGAWDAFDDATIGTRHKSKKLAKLAGWPEESVNTTYEGVVLAVEALREMAKKAGWVKVASEVESVW